MQSGRWSGLNGCWTDTNECKASAISARCCLGVACVVCQRWIRSVYQVRESLLCWSCASILLHNPTGKEQTNDTVHCPLATPLTWSEAQTEGMKQYLTIKINRRVFLCDFIVYSASWTYIHLNFFHFDRVICRRVRKSAKRACSFVASVRPFACVFVRAHGISRLALDGFRKIWYLCMFLKSVEKVRVLLKSDKQKKYLTRRPVYISDSISPNSS